MSLEKHREVLLRIYCIDYLLRCRVDDNSGEIVKLSPLSGRTDMFQRYDPVVLITYDNNMVLDTVPADVTSIDAMRGQVSLWIRRKEINEERRVFERYPVSLMVSARKKFSSRRINLIVKNISLYGMGAVSDAELYEEDFLDIDLLTDRNMFYFNGQVIWRNSLGGRSYEYGLKLVNYDIATKYSFEEFLKKQKDIYLNMIPKAR